MGLYLLITLIKVLITLLTKSPDPLSRPSNLTVRKTAICLEVCSLIVRLRNPLRKKYPLNLTLSQIGISVGVLELLAPFQV